jgi:hypothetical protein
MIAAEANCVFKRPQLNFFVASIQAEKLEALAVNKSKVWLGPAIETLNRARGGSDLDRVRRNIDDLAITDKQRSAGKVDLAPELGDAEKFVVGPAETVGLVAMAGEQEGFQAAYSGPPALSGYVGGGQNSTAARKDWWRSDSSGSGPNPRAARARVSSPSRHAC